MDAAIALCKLLPYVAMLNTLSIVCLYSMPHTPHVCMFHSSSPTRVYVPCILPTRVHVPRLLLPHTYVPCLILHKGLCFMPPPPQVFMLNTPSFVKCLRSMPPPPHVCVPYLILHTCLCFMPQPPHVFVLNTSSFVKCLCSMPPPPHAYMFHISSSTRVYVPCLILHTCLC